MLISKRCYEHYFLLNKGTEEQASPYITLLATSWILAVAQR